MPCFFFLGAGLPPPVARVWKILRDSCRKIKRAATRATLSKIARKLLGASALLLLFGRLLSRWWSGRLRRRRRCVRRAGHAFLEVANSFAETPRQFGNLPPAE